MKKLSKFILNNIKILFLISFSLLSRSLYGQNGGGGAIPPTPEAPMGATNPVLMVIGIYYYSKNKKEVYK